ncbi:hypothetical protein WJX74_007500 [Apatococcus lobatus]|uniref:Pseudouridine synthase RsuA/RluA-like domain-containing protein n=1 Tax=Apatococcus lobatus TaxID=904363 RepID=A0AAW1RAF1_9CHLO
MRGYAAKHLLTHRALGLFTRAPPQQRCCFVRQLLRRPSYKAFASGVSQSEPGVSKQSVYRRQQQERAGAAWLEEPFTCPACRHGSWRADKLQRHLQKCCPDLLPTGLDISSLPQLEIRQILESLRPQELELQAASLQLGWRDFDQDGNRIQRDVPEVAAILGLPRDRTKMLMHRAMKSIPLVADEEPIDILYEDEWLLAANKPPGIITAPKHRFQGGSLVNRIIGYLGRPPYPIHRLDMYTSGVVIVAKHASVVQRLHELFREREVKKVYCALSVGKLPPGNICVDGAIGQSPREKLARTVTDDGQPAVTSFLGMSSAQYDLSQAAKPSLLNPGLQDIDLTQVSVVRCAPKTGKTHQIRVHLAHIGHPIIGDEIYGIQGPWIGRQALHAACLQFVHPATGRALNIEAKLPKDMLDAINALGLQEPAALI